MKQYALYIQKYNKNNNKINNNNNNKNENKMKSQKEEKGISSAERERGKAWRERILIFFYFFLRFFLRSMKIRQQVFVGAEGKVDLRDESYAWTPKSWSFVKLHEVGNFPTCVISSLKVI